MKLKTNSSGLSTAGVALAYVMWGLLTIFWNLLSDVNSVFILSQRIIWSMVVMGIVIGFSGGFGEIREIFHNRKNFLLCVACGILITINWGIYIYAVSTGHVLDASLGYFIEPVIVALTGLVVFREKPSNLEKITFVFAVVGLAFIIIKTGAVPTLSLLIAGSFAIYGAVKKTFEISAGASLFMETLVMTPFAIAFAVYAQCHGMGTTGVIGGAKLLLLPACGIVTSLPLLLYNLGVKNIKYYFTGILMYINPTLQFVTGYFLFKESLDKNRLIAFIIIWIGVLFTIADKIHSAVRSNR